MNKKIRKYLGGKLLFLRNWHWRLFHPEKVARMGLTLAIDPYVVPYYIAKKNTFKRILPVFNFFVGKNSTVVDVGASFGFYSLYSSKVSRAKKVIAFEPTSRSFRLFLKNIKENYLHNIAAHQLAIGEEEGEAKLYWDESCFGSNSLIRKSSRYELVKVMPLDKLVSRADFVKIDVEGAEYEVLQGMKRILSTSKPPLLLELSCRKEEIMRFLQAYDYRAVLSIGHNLLALHKKDQGKLAGLKQQLAEFGKKNPVKVTYYPFV